MTVFDLSGAPRRIHPMIVGYEPIREEISLLGGDPARFLLEPVTATAVVYDDGWALLDSGFNVEVIRDPVLRARHYNFDGYTALVPPGDPLAEQVAALGLNWSDLRGVAVSHIHLDHTGGLRLVPDGVPVAFQRAEYDFGAALSAEEAFKQVVVTADFLRPGLDIRLLDGDAPLAPGLTALDTAGHTPGHQSFAIELPSRTVVLACDAADLHRNIAESIPCGSTMRPSDAPAAQRAIDRLHALDQQPGVEVWPAHDPDWPHWRERTVA